MRATIQRCGAGVALLLLPVAVAAGAAAVPPALQQLLDAHGLATESEPARRIALEALARRLDARARLVDLAATAPATPPAPRVECWPGGLLLLAPGGLTPGVATALTARVAQWPVAGRAGVLLDLRGANGDSLDDLDGVAALFMTPDEAAYGLSPAPGGPVTPRHAVAPPLAATAAAPALAGLPVVALVDADTRGGAEILAALLRRRGDAMLLGRATGGELGVREVVPLSEREGLYLMTRRAVGLTGAALTADAGGGLRPDIQTATLSAAAPVSNAVPWRRLVTEQVALDRELRRRVGADADLQRAVDILLGLRALWRSEPIPAAPAPAVRLEGAP